MIENSCFSLAPRVDGAMSSADVQKQQIEVAKTQQEESAAVSLGKGGQFLIG